LELKRKFEEVVHRVVLTYASYKPARITQPNNEEASIEVFDFISRGWFCEWMLA